MNSQAQNYSNAALWAQKAFAQAASGPDVPAPPDGPIVAAASPGQLPPLPDGVTFDPANTGAVLFSGAHGDKANEPFFWSGALPSVQRGSQQYANIAYNTQTQEFTMQVGWLPQPSRMMLPLPNALLTGLPGWDTANGPVITPAVRSIPLSFNTLEKALAYIADPQAAWDKYRQK